MKALVFEGGGILGAAQPVLLNKLVQEQKLDLADYQVFVGSSIGSINALWCALGRPLDELERLWSIVRVSEVMPKKHWNLWGQRRNLVEQFVKLQILDPVKLIPSYSFTELYEDTGHLFYTTAYCLQQAKTLIFGYHAHGREVAQACRYSTSHPLKFEPNPWYDPLTGQTYDLSDGGIAQNCPLLPLVYLPEVEEVTVLALSARPVPPRRLTRPLPVLKAIVASLVTANEHTSYALGHALWPGRFHLYECQLPDYDLFDTQRIHDVMEYAEDHCPAEETAPVALRQPERWSEVRLALDDLVLR